MSIKGFNKFITTFLLLSYFLLDFSCVFSLGPSTKVPGKVENGKIYCNTSSGVFCDDSTQQCIDPGPSGACFDKNYSTDPSSYVVMSTGLPFPGMSRGAKVSVDTGMGAILKNIIGFILGSVGTVATIVFIVSGFMWAFSAGNSGTIGKAKDMMKNAVIGLVLTVFSGAALKIVNPNLVDLGIFNKGFGVQEVKIDKVAGDAMPSSTGSMGKPYSREAEVTVNYLKKLGIDCDINNNKASSISKVANSFNGKIAYRLGSKNGMGTDIEDSLVCPRDKACYDCSGYVKQVLYCSGYKYDEIPAVVLNGDSTDQYFKGAEDIKNNTDCTGNDTINGKKLKPGDLVGWVPFVSGNTGHVLVYVGNGILMDSHWVKERDSNSLGTYSMSICSYYKNIIKPLAAYKDAKVQLKVLRVTK